MPRKRSTWEEKGKNFIFLTNFTIHFTLCFLFIKVCPIWPKEDPAFQIRQITRIINNNKVNINILYIFFIYIITYIISYHFISIYLSIYLSICLSIYLLIYLSIYLSICLSIHLSIHLSIYLPIYLSKRSNLIEARWG